jgi:chemotaxis protein methyltransferase CheR
LFLHAEKEPYSPARRVVATFGEIMARKSRKASREKRSQVPGQIFETAAIDASRFMRSREPLQMLFTHVQRSVGLSAAGGESGRLERLIGPRLDQLAIDVGGYVKRCAKDHLERLALLDFVPREPGQWFAGRRHFEDLEQRVIPAVAARQRRGEKPSLRIWCATAGTGEEAYSIATTVRRALPDLERWDAAILATDFSLGALATAQIGHYPAKTVSALDAERRQRALVPYEPTQGQHSPHPLVSVRPEVRRLVRFAWLNPGGEWPFTGPFDVVFCRGLLSKLDDSVRPRVIERLVKVMRKRGTLYLGEDEALPNPTLGFPRVLGPGIHVRTSGEAISGV